MYLCECLHRPSELQRFKLQLTPGCCHVPLCVNIGYSLRTIHSYSCTHIGLIDTVVSINTITETSLVVFVRLRTTKRMFRVKCTYYVIFNKKLFCNIISII